MSTPKVTKFQFVTGAAPNECRSCGSAGEPLTHCAYCGELIPVAVEPVTEIDRLRAEVETLRARLSVAKSQTDSDKKLIAELRGALDHMAWKP